jgi:hypothetical protein
MEQEREMTGAGKIIRDDEPSVIMVSKSGFDLLHTGYELAEEDRLAELLTPYAEYAEDDPGEGPVDERSIAEVEEILETSLLSNSARLRARVEIVEFLEGRLEPSVFIEHAIDRQCAREGPREDQRRLQELRLTIGES